MTATDSVKDRTRGLGGSDMAAILGMDGFGRTPLDVYLTMIGEAEPIEETEPMFWGRELEDVVAKRWASIHGVEVRRKNDPVIHPKHKWMRGHIDRIITGRKDEGLEVKVSSADGWGEEGSADIPDHYLPQVHHYMTAKGAVRWHVAVLLCRFGPPTLRSYVIERDDEISDGLILRGEEFIHNHVEPRIPPDPESSEQANRLWRRAVTGKRVIVPETTVATIAYLQLTKERQKELKTERDNLELALKTHLKTADHGIFDAGADESGEAIYTWKEQSQNRFDQKRLQQERPDIYEEFVKKITFRKLNITKHGKELAAREFSIQEKEAS
jgi:putative phage-type endonuclease